MSLWKDGLYALSNRYDICILGEDGIGKSSLVYSFLYGRLPELSEVTYENLYHKNVQVDSVYTGITILDTSSIEEYSSHRLKQLQNAASIIVMYAIDDEQSFSAMVDMYERVRSDSVPVSVVGLKADRATYRQITSEALREFLDSADLVHYCECSAVSGSLVDEAFIPMVRYLVNNNKKTQPDSSTVNSKKSEIMDSEVPIRMASEENLVTLPELKNDTASRVSSKSTSEPNSIPGHPSQVKTNTQAFKSDSIDDSPRGKSPKINHDVREISRSGSKSTTAKRAESSCCTIT